MVKEGHPQKWTNLKDYSSTFMLDLNNTDNASISFDWYFGPNDFQVLTNSNKDYNRIINYGWGLFRWLNVYVFAPIYTTLVGNFAISAGIAILILTLIIKLILIPVQWKMYVSSAKMRILKPEIDELNKKYPKQEDAMKKQMEMMTLYRESGASPRFLVVFNVVSKHQFYLQFSAISLQNFHFVNNLSYGQKIYLPTTLFGILV
ncbi:MAG: YidC/Oxa1 family membrane protein insertase [Crocinitomicaceae bacterium]